MNWQEFIAQQQQLPYFTQIESFVAQQRESGKQIYPPQDQVFAAFDSTPLDNVKVIILGQDPYHGANQAHGLSFSVLPGNKTPPSLRNIYKELDSDIAGFSVPEHGCLSYWAEQGVLLLNTVLTVEEGLAHSHAKCGWETFSQAVIKLLSEHKQGLVFMLWGAHAQKKGAEIDDSKHLVLSCAHPSPLSARRGFFGCRHFSLANQYLTSNGRSQIDWQIPTNPD